MDGQRRLETRVPTRLTPKEGRRFGLTLGAAFVVLGALLGWRGHATAAPVVATLGAALTVAGLVAPTRLGPLERTWSGLGVAISRITTPIFLGILYVGVITPAGLLLRLAGRNPLGRPRQQPSFWVPRGADARRRSDMQRLF